MSWFNYYGLIIMAVIMIPNIIFSVLHKDGFINGYKNKFVSVTEQIGRYGCFVLMIFNIPYTWYGFYFPFGEVVYIAVNSALLLIYVLSWVCLWKREGLLKALLLSVVPSVIFLFSGAVIASIPLLVFAVIFAAAHILISVKNVTIGTANHEKDNGGE